MSPLSYQSHSWLELHPEAAQDESFAGHFHPESVSVKIFESAVLQPERHFPWKASVVLRCQQLCHDPDYYRENWWSLSQSMSAYAVCIFLSAYIRTVCSVAGIVQENGLNSLSKTPFVFRYRMIRLSSTKMYHRTVLNKTVLKRTFNCNHTHKKRFVKNNLKNCVTKL